MQQKMFAMPENFKTAMEYENDLHKLHNQDCFQTH